MNVTELNEASKKYYGDNEGLKRKLHEYLISTGLIKLTKKVNNMTTSTKESNTGEDIFYRGSLIENLKGAVYIVAELESDTVNTTCVYHKDKSFIGAYEDWSDNYASTNFKQFNGTITLKSSNNE